MTKTFTKYITLSLLLTVLSTSYIYSQEAEKQHPLLNEKFYFGLGVFYPAKTISAGSNGFTKNKDVEFAHAFGIEDNELTIFAGFKWRFAKKWKLSTDYFGINNSGSKIIEEDINWDDFTLLEGTNVYGEVGLTIFRVYVGRIFSSGPKHEFGGGLGVHALNSKIIVEGEALTSIGDKSFETSRKLATLALPNIGLWYFYAPNSKWAFTSNFDIFYLSVGNYTGKLVNLTPGVNYQFFNNVSAALNYRFIDIGAKFETSDWNGNLDFSFSGPSLTVNVNF